MLLYCRPITTIITSTSTCAPLAGTVLCIGCSISSLYFYDLIAVSHTSPIIRGHKRSKHDIDLNGAPKTARQRFLILLSVALVLFPTFGFQKGPSTAYLDLGDCDQICEHCYACFWYAKRRKGLPENQRPKYSRCCKGGRVMLPLPRQPPKIIKELFKDKHFMENIRAYNMMFAMTSFGAKVDDSVNNWSGPYVFKVEGQISHWMGSLCPPTDGNPRFLKMYIYDTNNEVCNRLHHFSGSEFGDLKPEIVKTLIDILDKINDLVKLFRTTRDICFHEQPQEFMVRLYNSGNQMHYNAPTLGVLGGIVYDSGPTCKNDFDILIRMRDGRPRRINKLHPLYMALQFPLLFVFGEHGWSIELKQVNDGCIVQR
ncbi:unnamed protein product [Lactuca saligna]|uniref:Helitron helicase-like domain-containing protein n=1 Tax=Lactuca saligna TaxID=75948 RepID=A0AA35ZRA9_LACSI|nr:unnamed protein product [Lactuca saligna]